MVEVGPKILQVSTREPLAGGEAIAKQIVLPLIGHFTRDMSIEERLVVWAGAFGTLSGAMAASVGPEAADVLLEKMREIVKTVTVEEAAAGAH